MIKIEKDVWVGAFLLIVIGSVFLFISPLFDPGNFSAVSNTIGSVLISFGITIIALRTAVKSADSSEERLNELEGMIGRLEGRLRELEGSINEMLDKIEELKIALDSINENLKECDKKSE